MAEAKGVKGGRTPFGGGGSGLVTPTGRRLSASIFRVRDKITPRSSPQGTPRSSRRQESRGRAEGNEAPGWSGAALLEDAAGANGSGTVGANGSGTAGAAPAKHQPAKRQSHTPPATRLVRSAARATPVATGLPPQLDELLRIGAALCDLASTQLESLLSSVGVPASAVPCLAGGSGTLGSRHGGGHRLSKVWMAEEMRRIFLTASLPKQTLAPGEVLIKEGVASSTIYLLLSGRLIVSKE